MAATRVIRILLRRAVVAEDLAVDQAALVDRRKERRHKDWEVTVDQAEAGPVGLLRLAPARQDRTTGR